MSLDRDWDSIRPNRFHGASEAGMGLLRITLLFGSAAVALALLATPYLDSRTRLQATGDDLAGVDMMSTASIGQHDTYTLRRSVLQPLPDSVCVIRDNGRRSGDC
ncbi:hypothetical protein OHD62_13170 [Mesorhizobium sp. YC-39]|uniref:hypothetical protein n=1 Tax=unclassified Mesorhizobium TaxID=325217 RepID=UPI0021E72272|nr:MULTISPECIES: hypothetical protein [unclassified Mesorhizobium]MCV3207590.1 hypothetical protein [Mesorhizobium sp. YC-2]MCV3229317.1 hypothetical protein [Mesorhizobium sp. YC-39]